MVKSRFHLLIYLVYHVHKDGWTKIEEGVDTNKLHYKYAAEKSIQNYLIKCLFLKRSCWRWR
jgi:hypothetical protein